MKGTFIVLEGCDASGKGTQSKILAERMGEGTRLFSFPRYETTVGRAIARHLKGQITVREEHSIDSSDHTIDSMTTWRTAPEDALVFQCMQFADKAAAAPDICQILANGRDVVCDRWWHSGYVYGTADGLDGLWIRLLNGILPEPDLILCLDVTVEESIRRRPARRDRYERDQAKMKAVINGYRNMFLTMGGIIDGMLPIEVVAEDIWNCVLRVKARKSSE